MKFEIDSHRHEGHSFQIEVWITELGPTITLQYVSTVTELTPFACNRYGQSSGPAMILLDVAEGLAIGFPFAQGECLDYLVPVL